ncbi:hypothetical protein EZV77_21940 [Burkholderia thailandensis]|nr:hypothetical protein CWD92_14635 [Burkholderia thailandensis]TBW59333.1 hypothetical protein EZV77_21940 [Burkholderia thailandensis]
MTLTLSEKVKNTDFVALTRSRLLFIRNRQYADTEECSWRLRQKGCVKRSKMPFKTNTYKRGAFLLFLVLEKLISLFVNGGPRVHP